MYKSIVARTLTCQKNLWGPQIEVVRRTNVSPWRSAKRPYECSRSLNRCRKYEMNIVCKNQMKDINAKEIVYIFSVRLCAHGKINDHDVPTFLENSFYSHATIHDD